MAILGYMSPYFLTPNLMATFSLKKEKRKKNKQKKSLDFEAAAEVSGLEPSKAVSHVILDLPGSPFLHSDFAPLGEEAPLPPLPPLGNTIFLGLFQFKLCPLPESVSERQFLLAHPCYRSHPLPEHTEQTVPARKHTERPKPEHWGPTSGFRPDPGAVRLCNPHSGPVGSSFPSC